MEWSVIPNKYLNYTSKPDDGDLVLADNVISNSGKLISRPGWQWGGGEDKPFLGLGIGDDTVPVTGTFFNNSPWFFFKDYKNNQAQFAYKSSMSPTSAWRIGDNSQMIEDFGADPANYKPNIYENAKRLLIGSKRGLSVVPRLSEDYAVSGRYRGATPRIAGSSTALGFENGSVSVATSGALAQDWFPTGAQVAYRVVWSFSDSNGYYVFGAPSDRLVVRNTSGANRAVSFNIIVPDKVIDLMSATFQIFPVAEIYRTRTQLADDAGNPIDPGDEMYYVGEVRPTFPVVPNTIAFTDISTDSILQDPLYTNELQEGALAARYNIPPFKVGHIWQGQHFFGNFWNPYITNFELGSSEDTGVAAPANRRGLRDGDVLILGDIAIQMTNAAVPSAKQARLSQTTGVASQVIRVQETCLSVVSKFNLSAKSIGSRYSLHLDNGADDFVGKLRLTSIDNSDVSQLSDVYYKPFVGLYRANGWVTANDPSPISPDPRINQNKGVGFLLTGVDRVAGAGSQPLIFTANAPVDFVDGDVVQLGRMDDSAVGVGWTYVPAGVYKAAAVSGATFRLESPTSPGVYVSAPAAAFPYLSPTGLGAVVCVRDSQSLRLNQCGPDDNYYPARIGFSPPFEPEAWKQFSDWITIGDSSKQIVGIGSVGDNLLVFKEDGLYRVFGEYPDFQVVQADDTCVLWGGQNVVSGDSACYAWGQKGFYEITLNRVQIISQDIQPEIDRIIKTSDPKPAYLIAHRGRNVIEFWFNDPLITSVSNKEHANSAFVFDGYGFTKRIEPMSISFTGTKTDYSSSEVQFGFRPFANTLLIERVSATSYDESDENYPFSNAITVDDESNCVLTVSGNTFDVGVGSEFMSWLPSKLIYSHWRTNESDALNLGDFLVVGASNTSLTTVRLTVGLAGLAIDSNLDTGGLVLAFGGTGAKLMTNSRFYTNIIKSIAVAFGGNPNELSRATLAKLELDQPRFTVADFSVYTDITYSRSSIYKILGYALSTSATTQWSLLPGVPLLNIGPKSVGVSIPVSHQSGYQFYFRVDHSFGGENFSLISTSIYSGTGNSNIARKNET